MKKMKKITSLVLAVTMLASVATACAKPADPATSAAPAASDAAAVVDPAAPADAAATGTSDTLVYNVGAMIKTLDPALNNAVDGAIILCNIFEGLYQLDENNQPVPGNAESVDVSDDLLTYTFHLREGLKWSDGQPITAANYEYAWKRALAPETAAEYAYLMYYIKGAEDYNSGTGKVEDVAVKAIDDKTLEVTLAVPTSYFLSLAAFPTYFPVREDIVSANPEKWTLDAKTFVTNGKYTVTEMNDKVNFMLTKNANYWDPSVVKLNQVDVREVEDENSSWATFQSGGFDMVDKVPSSETKTGVEAGTVKIYPYIGTYFVVLNLDETKAAAINPEAAKALQDVKVREALSLAIDRTQITEFVRKDGSTPAYSYVPQAITNSDGSSFAQKEYFKPEGDVTKAKALLAEAGFPDGKGFPTMIYSYNAGAGHEAIAQALQGMWKDNLGITVELKNLEWAAHQTARDNRDYLIARHGWIADYNDATSFLEMFLSNSGQNNAAYNNPKYDAALKAAQAETDLAKRDTLLHQAEDMFMADMPVIPIFYYTNPKGVQPYVSGLRCSVLGFIYFDQVVINK